MNNRTIKYHWDAQVGGSEGWYVEVLEDGLTVGDSVKVWFPVDVDQFDETQETDLIAALQVEYPDANIEAK